jgi:penicillin-binding protein 2
MKFRIFRLIILLSFGVIAFQLFQLQIAAGDQYRRLADRNRFRILSEDAPRGVIYDRSGAILARNNPNHSIAVVPADLPEDAVQRDKVYQQLAKLLNIPIHTRRIIPSLGDGVRTAPPEYEKGIAQQVEENRFNPFGYVVIKPNVTREIANIIEEMRPDLPGVHVLREPSRTYPFKENLAHLLGYMGGIPADQLKDYQELGRGYELTDKVGLSGLEYTFEGELRGDKGLKLLEVDASGREIRTVATQDAAPGRNLVLTLDMALQNAAIEALKKQLNSPRSLSKSGVVIAMNPNTAEILALVSWPSYDNNLFANGISTQDYARLLNDPLLPLFNRAISGEYPLGSIFKIVPASAALQEGIVDVSTGILDAGVMWVPNKFYPNEPRLAQPFYGWNRQGLGLMNVTSALAWSSDIYFYQVAGGYQDFKGLGLPKLVEYSGYYGFGKPTGISLPGEASGLLPSDRWKRLTYGQSWLTGDTYNMGIGQGFLLGTPLQILNATAAVVNGGTLRKPYLVRAIADANGRILKEFQPEIIRKIPVSPENLAIVRQGLRMVVTEGTAPKINLADVKVAGKTGTAEYPGKRDRRGFLPTHAWFTAFAPYDDPQITLVVFIEGGGEGSQVAVPVAAEILRAYFRLPKDSPLATEPDPTVRGAATPIIPINTANTPITESPQAGARAPYKPPDAPKTFKVRILAQETWSPSLAGVFGWVRDRDGRPLANMTLAIDGGGNVLSRQITDANGWFKYDLMSYDASREWHVRLEGIEGAELLTLKIQPSTKYTVLFYEE